jgi:hypothetical protein
MGVAMAPGEESGSSFEGNPDYEESLVSLEEETEQKVSFTISKIEVAIETWKAAGKKPDSLRLTIVRLQRFYDELTEWEKKSLEGKTDKSITARISRLREFAEICARYEKSNTKRAT